MGADLVAIQNLHPMAAPAQLLGRHVARVDLPEPGKPVSHKVKPSLIPSP